MKCYQRWQSQNRRLEENSNWRGGKSFEPYPLIWNKELREFIRERDRRICMICGLPEEINLKKCGEKLGIHHIDYNKENCDRLNLISLCHDCHTMTNFNRDYWQKYFTNLQPSLPIAVNQ
jgi:hypothetical protein